MAVKQGVYDSPLGRERTLRFLKAQDKALTAAEPLTQKLLGQTLEATEVFGPQPAQPQEPAFGLQPPQIQEPQQFGPQPAPAPSSFEQAQSFLSEPTAPAFNLQPPRFFNPPPPPPGPVLGPPLPPIVPQAFGPEGPAEFNEAIFGQPIYTTNERGERVRLIRGPVTVEGFPQPVEEQPERGELFRRLTPDELPEGRGFGGRAFEAARAPGKFAIEQAQNVLGTGLRVLEEERTATQQVTKPLFGAVAGPIAEQLIPPGPLANLPGVPEIPGRSRVVSAVETGIRVAGPEVALASNLITIPIVDPALARLLAVAAKGLGVTVRTGARVSRPALEALSKRAGDIAVSEGDTLLGRAARQFQDDAARLVQERPVAGAAKVRPATQLVRGEPGVYEGFRSAPLGSKGTQEGGTFIASTREVGETFQRQAKAGVAEGGDVLHRVTIRADKPFVMTDENASLVARWSLEDMPNRAFPITDAEVESVAQLFRESPLVIETPKNWDVLRRRGYDAIVIKPSNGKLGDFIIGLDPQKIEIRPVAGAAEPPGTPPATSPTGTQLPDRGRAAAQEALNLKEETLLRPGRATQLPGIKQAVSGLNPSVSIDREVLVSYNARQAVNATLETEFAAQRLGAVRGLQGAWDAAPPTYTGPKNNAIKNTIKDWADNPDFYSGVSPELRGAAKAYDDVSNQILGRTRGEYGVDIRAFGGKEGSFYLPTVAGRETLDASLLKVSDGYTSASVTGRGSRAKTRVYESAFQREQRNPGFKAETDLAELTSLHDRALASMSGNETFRLGAGGRTRLDVMQELHPDLFSRMIGLRRNLANLRGTAGRLNERVGAAIDDFLTAPDGELSNLADALDVTVTRGRLKGANVKAVNAEIRNVRQDIRKLRPAWEAANLEPFVFNKEHTFRYHTPEQSAAIDRILGTKLQMGDGLLQAIDEVRLFAFSADVSPLTIQFALGMLSNPITGARSLPGAARALLNPEELLRIAQREPEMVARFTQATGRPFGQIGSEFVQRAKGIERIKIPKIAQRIGIPDVRVGQELNDRLMSAVELLRYNQWKTDTWLAQLGGKAPNVADAEAANAVSKIIPALNPAERGASILQARAERIPFISTSFIGGPPTAMKDAASGLAKLTTSRALSPAARWQALAGREQLAILHLSSIAGTVITAGIATHIASGWSPEDAAKAVLDPRSSRFLSIALGPDRRIPIGGPLRSAVRAFAPRKVAEVNGVPVYVPFLGTAQWMKGKITPAIRTPIDLVRNEDYFGGQIATGSFPENVLRMIWFGINGVLPLAAAEPSEAIRRGEIEPTDIGGVAERAGAQLAGIDLRETSPFEQLGQARQDAMREQGIPGKFDDLDPIQQAQINLDPRVQAKQEALDAQPPRGAVGEAFDFLETLRAEQKIEQEADDDRLDANTMPGDRWRNRLADREQQGFAKRESIKEFAGIEFADKQRQPNKVRDATDAYFDVDLNDFTDPETGARDWEGFNAARVDALAPLTSQERQDFFDEVVGKFSTDRVREFRDATRLLNQAPPKVRGLTVALHEEIKDFMRTVWAARRFWRGEKGIEYDDLTIGEAVAIVAQHQGKSEAFTRWAQALRSGVPEDLRAEEYDDYLIQHVDAIRLFYPDLYTSGRILDRLFQGSAAAG